MTLVAGLPTSTVVTSRFDGSKCSRAAVERRRHQRGRAARPCREPGCRRVADRRRAPACRSTMMRPVSAAAPADLDRVAQRVRVGRLADEAVVEALAARLRPVEQLDGAVDGGPFLVAGDQEGRSSRRRPAAVRATIGRAPPRRSRDAALHVDGAAPVEHAVGDLAGKGRVCPPASSPGGTTSVWPAKTSCGRARPDRGRRGSRRPACPAPRRSGAATEASRSRSPASSASAPPSAGVTERQRTSACISATESVGSRGIGSPSAGRAQSRSSSLIDGLGAGLLVHALDDHGAVERRRRASRRARASAAASPETTTE